MKVTVRRATKTDAKAIERFAQNLARQHQSYDSQRFAWLDGFDNAASFYGSQVDKNDVAILVAEQKSEVVGFTYLGFEKINYVDLIENAVYIYDLYVDETARGEGAGKMLLDEAIKIARSFGANKVVLSVAAKNEIAQNLFERRGFYTTMLEMMLDLTESDTN
ncbi:MAG: GNAT family N-acetyltransferase [Pyrinomonadaceae bacterium]|nr:GNAT family N-acetyltransferase [Pyrinomonadaceae bacterium]